jgi:precorrin-2 dehydrogenase/sirohydrochlorin ferrochelatase
MRYYPIYLDIRGRPCLVVGGGGVGTRKVKGLLDCGARVTLISTEASEELCALADAGAITWHRRRYDPADLQGVFLVIGATDDEALNRRLSADAEARRLLCNIADRPAACNFILPSVVHRGDLILAVSTSGRSPAFAKHLRRRLEGEFGEEYAAMLRLMGAVRHKLLAEAHAPEAHKPLFEALIDGGLLAHIRRNNKSGINALLAEVLGEGYDYDELLQAEEHAAIHGADGD